MPQAMPQPPSGPVGKSGMNTRVLSGLHGHITHNLMENGDVASDQEANRNISDWDSICMQGDSNDYD